MWHTRDDKKAIYFLRFLSRYISRSAISIISSRLSLTGSKKTEAPALIFGVSWIGFFDPGTEILVVCNTLRMRVMMVVRSPRLRTTRHQTVSLQTTFSMIFPSDSRNLET